MKDEPVDAESGKMLYGLLKQLLPGKGFLLIALDTSSNKRSMVTNVREESIVQLLQETLQGIENLDKPRIDI